MHMKASTSRLPILGSLGAGAALMYLLDRAQGRRRRALLRDRAVQVLHRAGEALGTTARDTRQRAMGAVAEARTRVSGADEPSDQVLVDRVRAAMGRVVSHPSSITVTAHGGHVVLSGPILASEVNELLAGVREVRGVATVENRLDVHQEPGNVPGLQGGVPREGRRARPMQGDWAPAARLAAGAAGGALVVLGARKRGPVGTALGLTGASLLARSSTNMTMKRLVGLSGRRGVDLQKTITINAPVEQVFAFFREFENYPDFMTHVREVRDLGNDRTHWKVDGPAGVPVEWDAEVTKIVPNESISWKSVEGSTVEHVGTVQFEPVRGGATRVTVHMSYAPPAGAAGAVAGALLGANPKKQMDDDLARVKTTLETGTPPRDAARRTVS